MEIQQVACEPHPEVQRVAMTGIEKNMCQNEVSGLFLCFLHVYDLPISNFAIAGKNSQESQALR